MDLATAVVLVVLVAAVLLAVGAARTANRLDRLHVRTDAAQAALVAALDRRAVLTRVVAPAWPTATEELRAAADRSESVALDEREDAENDLGRLLDGLDRGGLEPLLAAEFADAQARVVIARRVYNDAVRDTRTLRGRRLVRWLRLAGRAPRPLYFEIAEPVDPS